MTRAEKVAEAHRLRGQGLLWREIAERLGVAYSTAQMYVADPQGEKARARRASYRGVCEVCGAQTDGSNGPANAPTRCVHHPKDRDPLWSREQIVEAIQAWVRTYGEIPASNDWNPYECRQRGHIERMRRFDRLHKMGMVPWVHSVVRAFGSWNDAIRAAGYEPRPPHGTQEGRDRWREERERYRKPKDEGVLLHEILPPEALAS